MLALAVPLVFFYFISIGIGKLAGPLTVFPWPVTTTDEESDFVTRLPFPPDGFQRDAFEAIDADHSVLVSAPTGSGKTLVAAYAIHRALGAGGKAFYTTPLKALSNQKYGELVATYGKDHVGLLTGRHGGAARMHQWW